MEYTVSNSRFQTLVIVALAFALGFAVSSSPAIGYPAGATVSTGSNPIWSEGGLLRNSGETKIVYAPDDADLIITDIILTNHYNNIDTVTMTDSEGTVHGQFQVLSYSGMDRHITHDYASGIRIPAGQFLRLNTTGDVYYSLSGYHAQP